MLEPQRQRYIEAYTIFVRGLNKEELELYTDMKVIIIPILFIYVSTLHCKKPEPHTARCKPHVARQFRNPHLAHKEPHMAHKEPHVWLAASRVWLRFFTVYGELMIYSSQNLLSTKYGY